MSEQPSANPMFAVGEIAVYFVPGSRRHLSEVTILGFKYSTKRRFPDGTVDHGFGCLIEFPGGERCDKEGRQYVAFPRELRKKNPPPDVRYAKEDSCLTI